MKTLFYMILVGALGAVSGGERTLETAEVHALLQTLTASPKSTWLSGGTIRTKYLEFRVGEEAAYESEEVFRFDGQRFYWEITLLDPPADAAPTPAVERPDHLTNKHRIFTYDGTAYTRYYKSADYAVVVMNQNEMPLHLFGPFSAGIIPWGMGSFTYQRLVARSPSAVEYQENGQSRIRLTLQDATDDAAFESVVVLDPAKQYAPCSFTLESPTASIQQRYRDIRQVGQSWIPFIITVERFNLGASAPTLVSYEDWRFLSVDAQAPTEGYSSAFANGTVVELQPYGQMKSFMYHAAEGVDIARLLEEKVMTLSAQNEEKLNCGALAAGHVARRFSKQICQTLAASSLDEAEAEPSMTSLYEISQSLEGAGLYCAAVKTDIESLTAFQNYGIILHFPGVKHYVVLDRIENGAVWTVDLTSRKFYWKRPIRELLTDWKEGVALLVSDKPILLSGQVQFLDVNQQKHILGGSTVGYSCTDLIQRYEHILCSQPMGGMCGGRYYKIWERYGCREDEPGMTCVGQQMVGYDYSHCINHPFYPNWCEITGRWYSRYIRACQ